MSEQPVRARPMSPCISICTMDDEGKCMGCRRTVEEIRGWAKLSADAQWELIEALQQRPVYNLD